MIDAQEPLKYFPNWLQLCEYINHICERIQAGNDWDMNSGLSTTVKQFALANDPELQRDRFPALTAPRLSLGKHYVCSNL